MGDIMELENKEICARCGGTCCKNSGCDYAPEDFDSIKTEYILKILSEGYVSIVSVQHFDIVNGKLVHWPFLYLRARGEGRGAVDLLSFKKRCVALTPTGCRYNFNRRPTGGKNLVPDPNFDCKPYIPQIEIINRWEPYQSVLARCVKRLTGKNVYEILREDAKNVFIDCFNKNFDGIAECEIKDMINLIPYLAKVYKAEYEEAEREILIARK